HWDDFDILLENMEAYDTALYLAGVTGIDGVLNIQGIYGDANHDGAINVLDMTRVARIVLEIDDRTQGSDANRDELINVLDITMIARKILGLD
ncbi:MAG: hypothetical protein JW712_05030, partial [Dehalococcoidales bacterium]|nr:hypothetical protein [Dehalococcoidales bacterium]